MMAPISPSTDHTYLAPQSVPRDAKKTSLRGGMQRSSQQALFVCLCLHCLTIDMPLESFVQSVERVVLR